MATTRISGMVSGMDVESIVTEMMKPYQAKLDTFDKNRQKLEWKADAYTTQNTKYAQFIIDSKTEFGLTSTSSSGTVINKSITSLEWVKKATLSDDSYATVTARADAPTGSYQVKVNSLADKWRAASSTKISSGSTDSLATQFGLSNDDVIAFKITANKGTDSEKSVNISLTNLASQTIDNLVNTINNSRIGATASYDEDIDRFFLETDEAGSGQTITITETTHHNDGSYFSFLTGETNAPKGTVAASTGMMSFDGPLYVRAGGAATGALTALADGADVTSYFNFSVSAGVTALATYNIDASGNGYVSFSMTGAGAGSTYEADASSLFDAAGNAYDPKLVAMSAGGLWAVDAAPTAAMSTTTAGITLAFSEAMYNSTGTAIADSADLTSRFTYTKGSSSSAALTSAIYDADTKTVSFTFSGTPVLGDTLVINDTLATDSMYDSRGQKYEPITMTYDGTEWVYGDQEAGGLGLKRYATTTATSTINIDTTGVTQGGTDANIDLGVATGIIYDSNEFTLNGLRFQLKAVGGPFTVTVAANTDEIFNKISAFVEKYNKLVSETGTVLSEERYKVSTREYIEPLTDAEREAMTDDQIEKWEDKAKQGILHNDSLVEGILTSMRSSLYQEVNFDNSLAYPTASINKGSNASNATWTLSEPLYYLSGGTTAGSLTVLASGTDIASQFQYTRITGSTGALGSAVYSGDTSDATSTPQLNLSITGTPQKGDAIVLMDGSAYDKYDADGNPYTPKRMVYDGKTWAWEKTNAYTSITSIGISTEEYASGSKGGQLVIDEDTLRDAINDDPDAVIQLLFKETSSEYQYKDEEDLTASQLKDKRSKEGLVYRLYDSMLTGMKDIVVKAGVGNDVSVYRKVSSTLLLDFVTTYGGISTIENDEYDIDEKVDDLEDRMEDIEDRYYNKFSAMETAMQKMQAQYQQMMSKMGASG